jgi:hypothetical protein
MCGTKFAYSLGYNIRGCLEVEKIAGVDNFFENFSTFFYKLWNFLKNYRPKITEFTISYSFGFQFDSDPGSSSFNFGLGPGKFLFLVPVPQDRDHDWSRTSLVLSQGQLH